MVPIEPQGAVELVNLDVGCTSGPLDAARPEVGDWVRTGALDRAPCARIALRLPSDLRGVGPARHVALLELGTC